MANKPYHMLFNLHNDLGLFYEALIEPSGAKLKDIRDTAARMTSAESDLSGCSESYMNFVRSCLDQFNEDLPNMISLGQLLKDHRENIAKASCKTELADAKKDAAAAKKVVMNAVKSITKAASNLDLAVQKHMKCLVKQAKDLSSMNKSTADRTEAGAKVVEEAQSALLAAKSVSPPPVPVPDDCPAIFKQAPFYDTPVLSLRSCSEAAGVSAALAWAIGEQPQWNPSIYKPCLVDCAGIAKCIAGDADYRRNNGQFLADFITSQQARSDRGRAQVRGE
eukprot:4775072-Alexandrium_andersonii.AAC.3